MTTPIMPEPVDAPGATPPQSGLIPAARKIGRVHEVGNDDFGLGGISYRPETTGAANARSARTDQVGSNVNRAEQVDTKENGLVNAYPIVLSVEESCSAFGWKQNDYEGRAKRALEALGSKILEWEFWTGEVAQADGLDPAVYQWLAQPRVAESGSVPAHGAVDLTPAGGALDPRKAIALLEEAIGKEGVGHSFLHLSRRAAVMLPDRWSEGPVISWPDSAVAVGAGYPGTGPDSQPAPEGEEWIYSTNLVDVWLGPVAQFPDTIDEALDRRKNTLAYRAERFGAVSWDGQAHYAIRVTI